MCPFLVGSFLRYELFLGNVAYCIRWHLICSQSSCYPLVNIMCPQNLLKLFLNYVAAAVEIENS